MFDSLKQAIEDRMARHRNRPFMESCMATCALIAIADGEVSLSERTRVDQILEAIDRLRVFEVHEAINLFNSHVEDIVNTGEKGRKRALDIIAAMRNDAGDAVLLVKIALAISRADGIFMESEREQCRAICSVLGLDISDYD